mgnify:FL=1
MIWSVKDRRSLIQDDLRAALHGYMAGILKHLESAAVIINSVPDHVHILNQLAKTIALCKVIEEVKKSSSKWMKAHGIADFAWQGGYGAFSVSQSNADSVREYIQNQAEHQKKLDFKEEFRRFCQRYNVPIDERYVWK